MSRAKWKSPYISNKLLLDINKTKLTEAYSAEIYTYCRSSSIIPNFVGKTLNIYNGKTFYKIKVTEAMIGRKLGEFSPTRKKFSFKKKKGK